MNQMTAHRIQRINELCTLRGWNIAELAGRAGYGGTSYWSDVLRGEKSFGEKAARKLETSLGIPQGWLDDVVSADRTQKEPSSRAREIALRLDAMPEGTYKAVVFEVVERLLAGNTST